MPLALAGCEKGQPIDKILIGDRMTSAPCNLRECTKENEVMREAGKKKSRATQREVVQN